MGWIRCKSSYTLYNVDQIEGIEIGNKTNGAVVEALFEREEMVVSIGYFADCKSAQAEIYRIQAWLADGAQGVYVVGEGPMGKKDEIDALLNAATNYTATLRESANQHCECRPGESCRAHWEAGTAGRFLAVLKGAARQLRAGAAQ